MNSINRKRVLIVAVAIILLCMSIVLGVTWALFSDLASVKNHLKAGDLEITLERVDLVKKTLSDLGYLEEVRVQDETKDAPVSFTDPTNKNVFGLDLDEGGKATEKIAPGAKFTAKMKISNNSDVAFGYWIEIVCTDKASGEALAKQLKVTVNTGSDKSDTVANGLKIGSASEHVDVLAKGESDTFTVTVEFLDSYKDSNGLEYGDNDLAQGEDLEFDLVVHAIQVTGA